MDDRTPQLRCERPHTRWVVPLISGHQRPAAPGDFRPRKKYGQGQETLPTAAGPAPGTYHQGATNKVTGGDSGQATAYGAGDLDAQPGILALAGV